MHIGLAEIHLERNEIDAAAERLASSLEVGERLALAQHAYRWRVVDARLRSIHGDHAGAIELLHEAERHYDTDYSPKARPVGATTARAHLAAGDLAAARRWSTAARLRASDDATYLREYEHLTLARLLISEGRPAEAAPLLDRVEAAARTGGRIGSAAEAAMLLALAQDAGGEREQAIVSLAAALELVEPEQQVRMFLDVGTPLVRLLDACVVSGSSVKPARALLAEITGASGSPSPKTPSGLIDELSSRELDVLRLLRSELTGPEIAAELFISLNTFRTHTKNIFTKLAVTNRRAAVLRADELGL
jgi:LuxR family maltose regulon positive regulatory protein